MSTIPSTIQNIDPWMLRLPKLVDRLGIPYGEVLPFAKKYSTICCSPRIKDTQYTTIGKDGFEAHIDIKHFKKGEISVKTVNNTIIVEGKHDNQEDKYGHVARHFIRKFELDYDCKEVTSTISPDGILTIKAPLPKEAAGEEIMVPIQETGVPHSHHLKMLEF